MTVQELDDRRKSLGASEIGAVAGLSPYRRPIDVWAEKVGLAEPFGGNEATAIGNALEAAVLDRLYGEPRGLRVVRPGRRVGRVSWQTATPDGLVETPDGPRIVECKVVGYRQARRWDPEGTGAEAIPPEVLCQVLWQMWVMGEASPATAIVEADVAALFGTDFRVYRVERDDGMIANLVEIARDFWRAVETREVPTADGPNAGDILAARYPQIRRPLLPATADVIALARDYQAARAAENDAAERKTDAANRLKELIADAVGYEGDGVRVTWKPQRGRIDWRAAAMARGETEQTAEPYCLSGGRALRVQVRDETEAP